MMLLKRFPPPWRVTERYGFFTVEDATGVAVAHVYFTEDPDKLAVAGRLSKKEARYVAARFASMPAVESAMMELEVERDEARAAAARTKR